MIIEKRTINEETVFAVCGDCRETGSKHPQEIVTFDDPETAVLVMKYMRGDRMPTNDAIEAREELRMIWRKDNGRD